MDINILVFYLIWIFKPKRKVDINNLKKLVYETGININNAYKGIKELETFFKEVEKIKQ